MYRVTKMCDLKTVTSVRFVALVYIMVSMDTFMQLYFFGYIWATATTKTLYLELIQIEKQ